MIMTRVEMEIRKKRIRKQRFTRKENQIRDYKLERELQPLFKCLFSIQFSKVRIGEQFFLNGQKWSKCGKNCAIVIGSGKLVEINPRDKVMVI